MVSGKARLAAGMSGLIVWVLMSSVLFAQPAEATQTEGKKSAAKLTIGAVTAGPGDPINVPLILSGEEPLGIRTVAIEISFPKKTLSFVGAQTSVLSESAQAEVRTIQKDASGDPDRSLLEVEVTVSAGGNLKAGTLAYLKFRVSRDAQLGTLRLEMKGTQATTGQGESLQMAEGNDGELTLREEDILLSCFFFTH